MRKEEDQEKPNMSNPASPSENDNVLQERLLQDVVEPQTLPEVPRTEEPKTSLKDCSNTTREKKGCSPTVEDSRERLKRHRTEMAGRVWIPDTWGQESFLKDWTDCSAFDNSLFPEGLLSAREALVRQRPASSGELRLENSC